MVIKQELCVDSGSMCFCNIQDLKELNADSFYRGMVIHLGKGKHKIKIHLPDTWEGQIEKNFSIEIEAESQFYIGDLCYCFSQHEKWDKFLSETNFMLDDNKYREIPTGGDGEFDVEVTITNESQDK